MVVDRTNNSADKVVDYAYQYYDANGKNNNRIRQITDNIETAYSTTYTYDNYNRLTNATANAFSRNYQYDEWGNIKNFSGLTLNYQTNPSGAPTTNRIDTDSQNYSYTYDAAGNMTVGAGQSYSYDGANRLKTASTGTSSYGYDGDGKRVKKTENGTTTYYVYSSKLGQSVMEVNPSSVQRAYVYSGNKLVAMQATDGQFYWLHTNHLGNSRAMTDGSGNLTYKGQFDPYGATLTEWANSGNTNLNSKKFTGYERDSATGLDYAQARMYNSSRGRFLTPDPIGLKGANTRQPESLNRYAYVQNDPVNFIDPLGLYGGWVFCGLMSFASTESWSVSDYRCGTYGASSQVDAPYIPLALDLSWMTEQKKCPWNPEKLDKALDYLKKSKIEDLVDSTQVSANGSGFILRFKSGTSEALGNILNNKNYWAGGEFGGQLHAKELKDVFGMDTAYFYDYRSFNGGNTTLGDRSMQVTLIYRDKERTQLIGAYTDTDQFNFRQDMVDAVGHLGELALHTFKKIFGKECD